MNSSELSFGTKVRVSFLDIKTKDFWTEGYAHLKTE